MEVAGDGLAPWLNGINGGDPDGHFAIEDRWEPPLRMGHEARMAWIDGLCPASERFILTVRTEPLRRRRFGHFRIIGTFATREAAWRGCLSLRRKAKTGSGLPATSI